MVYAKTEPEAGARESVINLAHRFRKASPAHGKPLAVPSQDLVLGCYYLTKAKAGAKGSRAAAGSHAAAGPVGIPTFTAPFVFATWLFLLPALALLGAIVVYPTIDTIAQSFQASSSRAWTSSATPAWSSASRPPVRRAWNYEEFSLMAPVNEANLRESRLITRPRRVAKVDATVLDALRLDHHPSFHGPAGDVKLLDVRLHQGVIALVAWTDERALVGGPGHHQPR